MSTINVKKFHIFQKGSDDLSDFNVQIGATLDTDALNNIKTQISDTPISLKNVSLDDSVIKKIKSSLKDTVSKIPNVGKNDSTKTTSKQIGAENKRIETQINRRKKLLNEVEYKLDVKEYDTKYNKLNSKLGNYISGTPEYENASKAVQNVRTNIDSLKKAITSGGSEVQKVEAVKRAYDELTRSVRLAENEMSSLSSVQDKAVSTTSLARTQKSFAEYWNRNTKALRKYRAEYERLEEQLGNIHTEAQHKQFKTDFIGLQTEIAKNGDLGLSPYDQLKQSFSRIAQFAGIYNVQTEALKYADQIIRNIVDVDSAMTELKKVSDITDNQISGFFKNATAQTQKYGATLTDVINSTADWSRLGYNLKESQELTEASLLYHNVGDNMTMEDVNENLISTLQGFQLDSSQATAIIDKINEVANNFAIDSKGIGDALKKSAASFNTANTDLSQAIALITATNTVIQDPDVVGNMWKTVSMRIRGAKTELEEAGEDTEGMVESTSELRDMVKQMTGFDIMVDENTFKNLYEIVIGIGEKWNELSDINQASLLEALAGKRQGNALAATLQNIDILKEAYQTAIDSEGSAERENAKYQESIQYSIDKTKASFQELSNDIIGSDFAKGFVDAGNTVINIFDEIVKHIGTVNTALIGFAGFKLFRSGRANSFNLEFNIECATDRLSREASEAA